MFTRDIEYEIILVDNDSKEEEPVPFENLFTTIKILRLDKNEGFAKGNNAGIKHAQGKYILLLNSDTVLKENSIKITYDYLENHPKVGVVSPRLIFPDGAHQSTAQRFPSVYYQLVELFRIQKLLPKKKRSSLLLGAFFDHTYNTRADWVWAAYFMFPKKILATLPNAQLDETYFMYMEDMQWCRDVSSLGYEVHFCAETEVIHLMGGSSGPKKSLMKKNFDLFLQKNYSSFHRFFINLLQKVYAISRS